MRHAQGGRARRGWIAGGFAAAVTVAVGMTATAFAAGGPTLTDDFQDGDTAGWSKSGGSWSVVTDGGRVLRQAGAGSDLARVFAGDTGWTDYTLQARVRALDLTAAGASAGVAARVSGARQFDRLVLVAEAARLEEVRGSSVTVLSSRPLATAAAGWHTLRIDVAGTQVTGYVDGTLIGRATGTLSQGRAGLLTTTASAEFDDVTVTGPSSVPASPAATAPPSPAATTAPVSGWPTPTGTTTLTATRKITGTFDGGNTRFVGGGALGGDGQEEGQDPLFELADGATLANVILGDPAADGVHCTGSCTLRNVWWQDVGEDAATFKGTSANQTMTVVGGGAMKASDKVFQHNGPGSVVIRDFQANDIGKLYRSCGNCSKQFARHVTITGVTVTTPLKALAGINPNLGDTATINNVTVIGGTSKTVICALFQGVTSGEPTQVGSAPDGKSCTASGIVLK